MSAQSLAVVILAAGRGTRMKSASPKVMHALAGRPMIQTLIETIEGLSPEKIIVVAGPDMPELEKAAAPHSVVVQAQRDGTGGAVRCALPALKGFEGNVLIVLGDTPLVKKETLRALIKAKGSGALSVLGCKMSDPAGYGRLKMAADGSLEAIVEDRDANLADKAIDLVNTGVFCVDSAKLAGWLSKLDNKNAQGEYYITQLPALAVADGGKVFISTTKDEGEVRGCNTRGDLALLEKTLQDRLRAKHMAAGVSLQDPQSVYFSCDTQVASDVVIEPQVFFGPGVRVEAGAHIKAFSHIEGSAIGKNVSVGPFARWRPGAEIGSGARIGNFVEIKASKIGKRSKIGHLAYVGDCEMGEDVNFSAGAITVNYDGFQKHKTVIGKGVMVGSNVNLVAPVRIDNGAFVAAGSTITEDVPANALSIARDVAEIRKGWAAAYRKKKAAKKKAKK